MIILFINVGHHWQIHVDKIRFTIGVFNLQRKTTIDNEIQFCSEDVLLEILKSKVRVNINCILNKTENFR